MPLASTLPAHEMDAVLSFPSPLGSVWDLSLLRMLFILRVWLSSGKPFETPEMCFHGEPKFCQADNQD